MKKKIIIGFTVVILCALAVAGFMFIKKSLSYKEITFALDNQVLSIDIYSKKEGEKKINSATNNQTIKLEEGHYYYIPNGEKIDASHVDFSVTKDETIAVYPPYSKDYLDKQSDIEFSSIKEVLDVRYPKAIKQFNVKKMAVLNRADWAGALLVNKAMDNNNPMPTYYVLFKKEDGKWKIINKPEVVLTKYNTPDVDINILRAVNSLY